MAIKYRGPVTKAVPKAPAKPPPPTSKTTLPKGPALPQPLAYKAGAGLTGLGKTIGTGAISALDALRRGMMGISPTAGNAGLAYAAGRGIDVIGSMAAKPLQLAANAGLGFLNQPMIPGSTANLGRAIGGAGRSALAGMVNLASMPARPGYDFLRGVLGAAGVNLPQMPLLRPYPQNMGYLQAKPWTAPPYTGLGPVDRLIDMPNFRGLANAESLAAALPKRRKNVYEEPVDYLPENPPGPGGDGYGGGGGGWGPEYAAGRSNPKQYGDQFYQDLTRWIGV